MESSENWSSPNKGETHVHKKNSFFDPGLLITLFLAGCNCTNDAVSAFEVFLDDPTDFEVISSLDFVWHGSDTCEPDIFRLIIQENIPYGGDGEYAEIDGDETSHTFPGGTLLPGREYGWYMQAKNEYDPNDEGGTRSGPESATEYFYTGPACGSGPLVAPEIVVPLANGSWKTKIDNWITHNHLQDFQWSYSGGCLPDYYDYEFATDSGFTSIVLSGTTTEQYSMHTYQTFPNCSTIFWRVRANHGGSVGPWSDIREFHWVREGTNCWQTNYISDDAARIFVRLYSDQCSQTGYNASTNVLSDPGCIGDGNSNMIVADGVKGPGDYTLGDYVVDLGSGPCPSTGLDQKPLKKLPFTVLAPGTYCVSISRNQYLDDYGINLMDGVWSYPRTNAVVAEQTVEIEPGNSDFMVEFGWDEYDLVFVMPEFEFTYECRICPDPIGPVTGFLFAGQPVPIFGRDYRSDWKLSVVEGMQCYVQISDLLVDEALAKLGGVELRSADMEQFPPAPPVQSRKRTPSSGR